jgi:hypothetical protein
MSVIAWADVQALYGYADAEETNVQRFIDGVEADVQRIAGIGLTSIERTEYVNGNGRNSIPLRYLPIASVSSIYIDAERQFPADSEYDGSYFIDHDSGRILLEGNYSLPELEKCIKVVYTGGLASIPKDLENAMLEHIQYLYDRNINKRAGLRSQAAGGGTQTEWEMTTPLLIQKKYQAFKRFHF